MKMEMKPERKTSMKRALIIIAVMTMTFLIVGTVSAATVVPNVDFSGNGKSVEMIYGTNPFPVTFVATLTPPAPPGMIVTYDWDFGDGSTMTDGPATISHPYNQLGHYSVSVVATGVSGWSQQWTSRVSKPDFVFVVHDLPAPDFTFTPAGGVGPIDITFTEDTTGFVTEYAWYISDQITGSGPVMIHTFPEVPVPTDFRVILNVKGDVDSVNSSPRIVTINPSFPEADITVVTSPVGVKPLAVQFDGSDSTGYDLTYNWSFDDGTFSELVNPVHIFTDNGTYGVSLTVVSAAGVFGQDIDYTSIYVLNSATDVCPIPEPIPVPTICPENTTEYIYVNTTEYVYVNTSSPDIDNIGIYRKLAGMWYLDTNGDRLYNLAVHFGGATDIPVPGDYNGDTFSDIAIFRPANGFWYIDTNRDGVVDIQKRFGGAADIVMPGDYNADGKTDIAIFRPANGFWYIDTNLDGMVDASFRYGGLNDVPLIGNWGISTPN